MQRQLEVSRQRLQHVAHPFLSPEGEAVDVRPTYEAHLRSQRHCLCDVRARPDARVEEDVEFRPDGVDDFR